MFNIGGSELFFIIFMVLMLFGSKKIPEIARGIGKPVPIAIAVAATLTAIPAAKANTMANSHSKAACSGDGIRTGGAEGRREKRGTTSAAKASTAAA